MLYIEPHLKQPFLENLDRDERIVWAGQPLQGIVFRPRDRFLIPFSLVWCGIITLWMISAVQSSFFFAIFGIPFVLIGLFLLIGRFFFDARTRARTYYAVTNKRALVKVLSRQVIFKEIQLNSDTAVELQEHPKSPNDMGSILFTSANLFDVKEKPTSLAAALTSTSQFYGISGASKVYREINQIREAQSCSEE